MNGQIPKQKKKADRVSLFVNTQSYRHRMLFGTLSRQAGDHGKPDREYLYNLLLICMKIERTNTKTKKNRPNSISRVPLLVVTQSMSQRFRKG